MPERPGYNPEAENTKYNRRLQEHLRGVEMHSLAINGLTYDDLRGKERVVDLGAGNAQLEEAARLQGIENVISIDANPKTLARSDRRFNKSDNPDLPGRTVAKANNMPLEDESVDLLVASYFPLAVEEFKGRPDLVVEEIERVLKHDGEAHMFPAHLVDIKEEVMEAHGIDAELLKKDWADRTAEERARIDAFEKEWADRSTQMLQELGHQVEMRANARYAEYQDDPHSGRGPTFSDKHYWVFTKPIPAEQ